MDNNPPEGELVGEGRSNPLGDAEKIFRQTGQAAPIG